MVSWAGFIKCDICHEKVKLEEKGIYNDLNLCKKCKIYLESKPNTRLSDEIKKSKKKNR